MESFPAIYTGGDLEIDALREEVRGAGGPVELRARPLRLLLYLLRHRDRRASGSLSGSAWGLALRTT